MAVIRLYRRFHKIDASITGVLYSPIDPISISTNVYLKNSTTLIEENTSIIKESEGVYYTDLNPNYYSYDNTYDLKWIIQYTDGSPLKTLITSFRINPINIIGEIYTEIENQTIEVIIL